MYMYMSVGAHVCTGASAVPHLHLLLHLPSHSRPAVPTAGQEWPHSQSHADGCSQMEETGIPTAPTRSCGGQY